MGPLFKVSSERPEKPKIKPTTPGLEGEQLDHYSFTVQVKLQNDIPVGYETQGPSPSSRAESRARIISIQSKYSLPDKAQSSKISYPS